MDTRATIEAILEQLYDARRRNDADAAAACFREDGRFMPNGAPAATTNRVEQLSALKGLFDAFVCIKLDVHSRIIDPPRAAVHWHGTFRAKNGKMGDTDFTPTGIYKDYYTAYANSVGVTNASIFDILACAGTLGNQARQPALIHP